MSDQYPSSRELRDWANAKQPGIVNEGGQLPRFVTLAWDKAHPDRPYVKSQAHHGTVSGYNKGCRCDRCTVVGRDNHRRRYTQSKAEHDEDLADGLAFGGAS